MEQVSQAVIEFISLWGYTAIVIGMALENACIPIPSELILGFAGYLVYLGWLDFTLSIVAGAAGGLIGSVVAYYIGFYGGKRFINKYGRYILLSKSHVNWAQKWFDRYGLKATFFSRLLPVVRTFISLPAGFAKVDFGKFVLYTLLGSTPWTISLLYAGQLLGENWTVINTIGHEASLVMIIGLAVAALYWRKKVKKTT